MSLAIAVRARASPQTVRRPWKRTSGPTMSALLSRR